MITHPWLQPSTALVAKVKRARATAALRILPKVGARQLGARAAAWPPLLAALPALLRADAGRVIDAVGRVDVLSALLELETGEVEADCLERALLTLWLGLAGHPGLKSPLALPGPFHVRVVDPHAACLLAFDNVRGLIATTHGPMVVGPEGRQAIDPCVVAALPSVNGTVIVDDQLCPADPDVVARVRVALERADARLAGRRLERVTIGTGEAMYGEARVGTDAEPAQLLASAQAAFVRVAAADEPLLDESGVRVENGSRVRSLAVLARACGNALALPLRTDPAAAVAAIVDDLEDLSVLATATPTGEALVAAIRALVGSGSVNPPRALLVNVDKDDFVYSFQFGRSVERRCRQRQLRVDRIAINSAARGDLAAELGESVPAPIADGTEFLVDSEHDPSLALTLRRLASRRYELVVANVRPGLFYDLLAIGLFTAPTLLWDRHLHGQLREEGGRRGYAPSDLRGLPIQAWSLDWRTGPGLQRSLAAAGLEHGSGRVWPLDLEFFQSKVPSRPNHLFAGGDNQRDWPLFLDAVRDLPLDVHLVTAANLACLAVPAHVHVDARLTLSGFRDAMGAATIAVVPLVARAAAGVSVIPMAMALGVAVVATRTPWTEPLVRDGEEALLVPPGDVRALRAAIVELFEQPKLRERLVANARRRVAVLCDLEAFTRDMFAALG